MSYGRTFWRLSKTYKFLHHLDIHKEMNSEVKKLLISVYGILKLIFAIVFASYRV